MQVLQKFEQYGYLLIKTSSKFLDGMKGLHQKIKQIL